MKREPALDGLRALAVVGVILFHAHTRFFSGGLRGVDVFFVLSGFLITSVLMKGPRLSDFYWRRARRLLPALFLLLLAYLAAGPLLFPADNVPKEAAWAISYAYNWTMVFDQHESGLIHLWSLAVEEQFYLLWPLTVPLLMRRASAALWLAAMWVVITLVRIPADLSGTKTYFSTLFHCTGLIAGALLAFRSPSSRFGWLGLAGLGFAYAFGRAGLGIIATPLAEMATFLLIPALLQPSRLQAAFAWSPFAWVGMISYGAYLWQWPIAYALEGQWYAAPATLVGSVGLAALSFYLVERRFLARVNVHRTAADGAAGVVINPDRVNV